MTTVQPDLLPAVDALTSDGAIVTIRPLTDADTDAVMDLFRRASGASLRLRFFINPGQPLLAAEAARLVKPPSPRHGTLGAELAGELVGVASYERRRPHDPQAEFAALVADACQGRGIGTLLLEHLARHARAQGITALAGEVLAGNSRMLRVAGDLTAATTAYLPDGVVEVMLSTTADEAAAAAQEARERVAGRASLRPLLAPRSVAVVGAGRADGIGHELLTGLVGYGFTGTVYPVDPYATTVAGVPAHHSLSALPAPVDLVLIAAPAPEVATVLAEAATAGARAAVVITAGFAESGAEGKATQAELVRLARANGIRLVGPNSLGLINTNPDVLLDASLTPTPPRPGGLAVASQSGAVGVAVLEQLERHECGVASFVSLGNKADVSGNDLMSYWYDDPQTRAVALYLESFGNPRKFARVARALARRKPVLAVVAGRSLAGRQAGESHTVAAALDVAVDSLFAQAGVIRVDHLGELADTARMLTDQPLPAGARLAVLGNAGGANVLAADAAEAAGLRLPAQLGGLGNPLDLGADATPAALAQAMSMMANSGEADALLVTVGTTRGNDPAAMWQAAAVVADQRSDLPVAGVTLGAGGPVTLGRRRAPMFDLPERAARALGRAAGYAAWRREPLGARPELSGIDSAAARAVVTEALADGAGWQPYHRIARILSAYQVPVLPSQSVPGHPSPPAPTASGDVELVAGITHDPLFGSLVMLGLGGVHADLLGDRTFRLVPVTDLDAGRMWRSLRTAPLLTGYRNNPPVDTAAVEDLLLRLGRLAEELPEVAELDLNPVLVGPDRVVVVDAAMRLAPAGPEPDPILRRLR